LFELASLFLAMLATGVAGGILAGLLGVGGGIVIVPMLEAALAFLKVDAGIRMHIAVATSLAVIIPTAISSSRAHYRRDSVDLAVIRQWAPWIFIGALGGTWVASLLESRVLYGVFGVMALVVAARMMMGRDASGTGRTLPRGLPGAPIPAFIGFFSSMMGIGGGSFSVPVMTWFGAPIHRAIGTASLIGLIIAVPGTLGFMVSGYGLPTLPWGSIGFVNLVGVAVIAPATVLAAPLGARLAHAAGRRLLAVLFGVFLLVIAVRMLLAAWGPPPML
jgi:uncharacterized membrane protein YfcA